LNQIEKMTFQ